MDSEVAVSVKHVSKTFRLPHEKQSSMKGALIHLAGGGKRTYEKQQALRDVSFEIKRGDFFGIVGRNGSGKSTLLKMLAGIYTPSKGNITVNGKLTPFIELGVGFNHELTGRENVFLNGALLGFSRKEVRAMYDDIVSFAELEKFMDQKLKNYSSGMQVRLAFSIAIRAKSDILLIDEVLAVGDAAFQQKCFNYFEELKRQKQTVVFVSHDMSTVRRFCTRAVYINEGKLTHIGSPTEIADVYIEKNINTDATESAQGPKLPAGNKVSVQISQRSSEGVRLEAGYETSSKDEVYVGISVIRDGISLAEINTLRQLKLKGKGKITYWLDTTIFNAGVYYVTVALFSAKNKELIAIGKSRSEFIIKGDEREILVKGAALKLADTWEQAKSTPRS